MHRNWGSFALPKLYAGRLFKIGDPLLNYKAIYVLVSLTLYNINIITRQRIYSRQTAYQKKNKNYKQSLLIFAIAWWFIPSSAIFFMDSSARANKNTSKLWTFIIFSIKAKYSQAKSKINTLLQRQYSNWPLSFQIAIFEELTQENASNIWKNFPKKNRNGMTYLYCKNSIKTI